MNGVIITGPTGAIGLALIQKCIAENVRVLAICHKASKRIHTIPKHRLVTILEADLAELCNIENNNNEQYEAFYHLGWQGTVGEARNDMSEQIKNIQYTLDAVELAERFHCRTFVGAGSQAEYGRVDGIITPETKTNPENGYGMAKLCAGQMSRQVCGLKKIKYIWARILSVYGPGDQANSMVMSTLIKMLHNEKTSFTPAEQIWDYLYSEDAAEYLLLLAKKGHDGEIYVLANGTARPLKEYIKIMQKVTQAEGEPGIGEIPYGNNQVMHLEANISKTIEDTGYTPETSFYEGIVSVVGQLKLFISAKGNS